MCTHFRCALNRTHFYYKKLEDEKEMPLPITYPLISNLDSKYKS